MPLLPKTVARHEKGQADHVDAWLMSYADLITLLFMFFVIFVSVTFAKQAPTASSVRGEPEHPKIEMRSGALALETPFEATYRSMMGTIAANKADQDIAVEKTTQGIAIDIAVPLAFEAGSADFRKDALPMLNALAASLKAADANFEIAAYTDDAKPRRADFADNWELSAMQAARMVQFLASAGVAPSRMRASGFADTRPVVPNRDELGNPITQNRERNRRIVIRLEKSTL